MDENGLLTRDQLDEVARFVEARPQLKHPYVMNICGADPLCVERVTPKNGLVFIKGNSNTGTTHIINRHAAVYNKPTWKTQPDKVSLDNPTRFPLNAPPVVYSEIADEIFDERNLNNCANSHPDEFDTIEGDHRLDGGDPIRYRLILYKNSKVVHSFYPVDKRLKRKKIIDYVRGHVSYKLFEKVSIRLFTIPFENHAARVIYQVSIFQYLSEMREEVILEEIDEHGAATAAYCLAQRPIAEISDPQNDMMYYQHAESLGFELWIRDIDQRSKGNSH